MILHFDITANFPILGAEGEVLEVNKRTMSVEAISLDQAIKEFCDRTGADAADITKIEQD